LFPGRPLALAFFLNVFQKEKYNDPDISAIGMSEELWDNNNNELLRGDRERSGVDTGMFT
jgi:hypothetical protein